MIAPVSDILTDVPLQVRFVLVHLFARLQTVHTFPELDTNVCNRVIKISAADIRCVCV